MTYPPKSLAAILALAVLCSSALAVEPAPESRPVTLDTRLRSIASQASTKTPPQLPRVLLKTELGDLFATVPAACGMTGEVRKKLEQRYSLPPDVTMDLRGELNLTVAKVDATYVRPLLHDVFRNGSPYAVTGAATFNTIDPLSLVDVNSNNYLYTIDCSGYLTSALSANVGLAIAEARGAARTATTKQWSLLIARARLWSPIAHAISPPDAPLPEKYRYTDLQRLDTLWAVHSRFSDLADSDTITIPTATDFLWTSQNGSSSFQGKVDLSSSASYGFGFGSVEGHLDAGASLARGSHFSTFVTYPLPRSDEAPTLTVPLETIRRQVRDLVERSNPITSTVDKTIHVTAALPANVCRADLHWSITDGTRSPLPARVVLTVTDGGCTFTITPDPPGQSSLERLQKAAVGVLATAEKVGTASLRIQVSLLSP